MSIRTVILLTATLFAITIANNCLANETYTCPVKIKVPFSPISAENMPSGFEGMIQTNLSYLSGSNMFDGHPKKEAALIPAFSSPDDSISRWNFEGEYPEGKWLSCDYELGAIRLAKRVGDSIKSCTATTKTLSKKDKTLEIRFDCK